MDLAESLGFAGWSLAVHRVDICCRRMILEAGPARTDRFGHLPFLWPSRSRSQEGLDLVILFGKVFFNAKHEARVFAAIA